MISKRRAPKRKLSRLERNHDVESVPPAGKILDDIVSLLCNEPKTLQGYFLVVRSWMPRTSSPVSSSLRPKPSNRRNVPGSFQPLFAPHVRYLDSISLNCHGGRCRNGCLDSQLFPCCTLGYEHARSKPLRDLVRFHGVSLALKPLRLCSILLPYLQIFCLIHSLPFAKTCLILIVYRIASGNG